jgi:hypothetical protein
MVAEAVQSSKTFNTNCTYVDEFDQIQVVKNTLFNLHCYNEFVKDTYETNKVKHFEFILAGNVFELSSQGVPAKLAKEARSQQSQLTEAMGDELFTEYREAEVKTDQKFQGITRAREYLKLPFVPEVLTQFKDIIMDKWKLRDHDAVIRCLKSDDHVNLKVANLDLKGIDVKNLTSGYHKLQIIRRFEAEFGVSLWEAQAPTKTDMDDKFYNLIRTVFCTKLAKPTTVE